MGEWIPPPPTPTHTQSICSGIDLACTTFPVLTLESLQYRDPHPVSTYPGVVHRPTPTPPTCQHWSTNAAARCSSSSSATACRPARQKARHRPTVAAAAGGGRWRWWRCTCTGQITAMEAMQVKDGVSEIHMQWTQQKDAQSLVVVVVDPVVLVVEVVDCSTSCGSS